MDNDKDGAKSAGANQNRQFMQKTNYSSQFSKAYMTDKNFNPISQQNEATDFKRSVYFTDEVKIRIEKVSDLLFMLVVMDFSHESHSID